MNPLDNGDQVAAERDVIAMWCDPRIEAVRPMIEAAWRNGWKDSIPDEAVDQVDGFVREHMTNWMFKAVASDPVRPRFVRTFMPTYSWHGHDVPGSRTGGDNPDNCYRLAGIEHGGRYRVTCRPVGREAAHVSFNLVGNFGTSVIIGSTESQKVARADDGSFVITIDDQPAGGRPNHLTTAPHVKFLFVRDSMEDWGAETPLDLAIERLDDPGRLPVSLDEMIDRAVFRTREDVSLYFWFQSALVNIRPGTLTQPAVGRGMGGMLTQGISMGHFRPADDEAVIIDYAPGPARYAAIELTDWFHRSIDAHRVQSSLTRGQSYGDADGRVRAVIARSDPGVANWLDTGGLEDVLFYLRWQGLPPGLEAGAIDVSARTVKLDRLKDDLPGDTAWVTPAERRTQIAARQAAFARRTTIT